MVFLRYKPSKSRNINISGEKIMVSPPGVELGLPGWNPQCLTTKLMCVPCLGPRIGAYKNSTWMTS